MLPRRLPPILALLLAAGGGLLTDTAFPDRGWWAMAFVGVGFLYIALSRQRPVFAATLGLIWGMAFFLPHIQWADYVVGPVPWVALSLAESLIIAATCAVWAFAARARIFTFIPLFAPLSFAMVWTTGEIVRSAWPFGGFPWGRLAFSQSTSPLGRLAWLGGPTAVSVATAFVAALVAIAFMYLVRLRLGAASGVSIVGFAVVLSGLLVPLASQAQNGVLNIGAVQGNVSKPGLGAFENRYEVLKNHVNGTYDLLDPYGPGAFDVVLWPENSSDVDPRTEREVYDLIDGAAKAVDAPILVGTQSYPATGGRFNEGALWLPGKGIVATYAKQHPAPFAEYIPMRDIARKFSKAVDLVTTDMIQGSGPGIFNIPTPRHDVPVPLGDVICFEVAYDDVVRDTVRAGAQALVIQTNNANFGYTAESTQQLAMAQLRAIETGRATVQISTVGVSAVIEPNGVITQRTELFTPATMVAKLPLRTDITPAVRLGLIPNMIAIIGAGIVLFTGIASTVTARARRRP